MLRYLLIGLLLAGCKSNATTIIDFEPTHTAETIVITSSGGNFITGPEILGSFRRGQEVTFTGSQLCSGGKCISARRDK